MTEDNLHKQVVNYFKRRFRKTWKIMVVMVGLVVLVVVGVAIFSPGGVTFYNRCTEAQEINEMSFNGIIEKKRNPNAQHGLHYLVIQSSNGENTLVLDGDRLVHKKTRKSFFWELMDEGDSVKKEAGTFEVNYKKLGKPWKTHKLGFELCE